ncbi:anti-sigma factor [Nocardia cyriacigeorgica]|uniref:Regulator of SigK n=1 Tax=Nocardia cyriacigeorgica TaxID=135487 RepID=A0A6P1D4L1_9NOCA|nr:anti-sigma factor [Nocardia cyriacigeorgica]NEW45407.1 anti-sigma factor [Nocardia cyriacigeorgica]
MTDAPPPDHPDDHDLLDLAHAYALDAVTEAERDSIEQRLATCDPETRRTFDQIVRDVREAMGALSALDAQTPPAALEGRILDAIEVPGDRDEPDGPLADDTGSSPDASGDGEPDSGDDPTNPADPDRPADTPGTGNAHLNIADNSVDVADSGQPSDTSDIPDQTGNTADAPADELAAARARRRTLLRWATATAAVAIVVAIGAAVFGQRTEESPARMVTADQVLQQPDARTATSPVSTGGTLVAYISDELGAVAVTFDAVPPPPDGYAHQLWLIGQEGVPRSAGVLTGLPTPDAPYVAEFAASDQLAVTVEPDGGSPGPTTDPIAALPLT